jgi:Tol biopolymer transport system component
MQIKNSRGFYLVAGLLVLIVIMACALIPSTNDPSSPSGSIIYTSDESGNFEIYHLYLNSSKPIRLTNNTSDETSPYYIPSALQIGFLSDKSGKYQLYTMSLTGSDETAWKKNDPRIFGSASVSPDRLQVAYVVQSNDKNSDLYLAKLDGTEERQLTKASGMSWDPSWSMDGKKIVYASNSDGDWEIYVVNVDDGKITKLTDNSSFDGNPRWSPIGDQILFDSDRDGDWEIFTMDSDGGNVKAITENSSSDWTPNWSPDGRWIVYVSGRDGDDEIYIVDADGKNQSKLTNNSAQDRYPVWIP